jgi:hypothetical protein
MRWWRLWRMRWWCGDGCGGCGDDGAMGFVGGWGDNVTMAMRGWCWCDNLWWVRWWCFTWLCRSRCAWLIMIVTASNRMIRSLYLVLFCRWHVLLSGEAERGNLTPLTPRMKGKCPREERLYSVALLPNCHCALVSLFFMSCHFLLF